MYVDIGSCTWSSTGATVAWARSWACMPGGCSQAPATRWRGAHSGTQQGRPRPPGGRFTMALLKPAASGWRLSGRDPRAARACFLLLRGGHCPPDSRLFGRPGRSLPDAASVIAPTSGSVSNGRRGRRFRLPPRGCLGRWLTAQRASRGAVPAHNEPDGRAPSLVRCRAPGRWWP